MTTYPGIEKNPWLSRAKKFLIAVLITVVEIANVWVDGPDWLYPAAAGAGAILLYFVKNAPKYQDPRPNK